MSYCYFKKCRSLCKPHQQVCRVWSQTAAESCDTTLPLSALHSHHRKTFTIVRHVAKPRLLICPRFQFLHHFVLPVIARVRSSLRCEWRNHDRLHHGDERRHVASPPSTYTHSPRLHYSSVQHYSGCKITFTANQFHSNCKAIYI